VRGEGAVGVLVDAVLEPPPILPDVKDRIPGAIGRATTGGGRAGAAGLAGGVSAEEAQRLGNSSIVALGASSNAAANSPATAARPRTVAPDSSVTSASSVNSSATALASPLC